MYITDKLKEKHKLNFNKEQLEILNHSFGPGIIHSTAGSGKTTLICSKVGKFVYDSNINPNNILVLSHSDASVKDISSRFKELMKGIIHLVDIEHITFRTIHSFGMSIIYYYSNKTGNRYSIAGTNGVKSTSSILSDIFYDIYRRAPQVSELDRLRNYMTILANDIRGKSNTPLIHDESIRYIYNKYQEYKRDKNIVDFDDMILLAIKMLKENHALRRHFQSRYEFILVDEVQDMSKMQYELLKLVVNDYQNVLAFGDMDQTIYSFRGSHSGIFTNFVKDFPSISKYTLNTNFRCSINIVKTSSEFIKLLSGRPDKDISAFNKKDGFITMLNFRNDEEQAKHVVREINNICDNNFGDTAILFRDNLSLIKPVISLINNGIDFYCNATERRFFHHFTKNDIVALLWLTYDRTLLIALYQFYNKIYLSLSKGDILRLHHNQNTNENIFKTFKRIGGFTTKQISAMERLEEDLDYAINLSPLEAIDFFLDEMGYKKYLSELTRGIGYENSVYYRYVDLMKYATRNEPRISTAVSWLNRLQDRVEKSAGNKDKNAVTLSTLHSAKGLEFNNVFIVDVNEGVLPSYIASRGEQPNLDEERRLMFVGLTRARKNLYVLSSGPKSQYIKEIESILELK